MDLISLIRRRAKSFFAFKGRTAPVRLYLECLEYRVVPAGPGGGAGGVGGAAPPNTWVVTTGLAANDQATTVGSLRWAITNAQAGDTIDFAIPVLGGNVATINLLNKLPQITQAVTINGYSEGGQGAPIGQPLVQIDGITATGGMINGNGLNLTGLSGGSLVEGLAIYDFGSNGISLNQTNVVGITVQGCYVGNNAAGNLALPMGAANMGDGILINSSDNTIGGTGAGTGNWITNSGANGVEIIVAAGNFLGSNTIGYMQPSTSSSNLNGVRVFRSNANTIGAPGAGNYITASGSDGVVLDFSNNNVVTENFIGTDGNVAIANGANGVHALDTCSGNEISENDIAGNKNDGILLESGVTSTAIEANYIGLTDNGSSALGNGANGVQVQGANNTIGGTNDNGDGNTISGNGNDGVFIDGSAATNNAISANYIGTDSTGMVSLGNSNMGIEISGSANTVGGGTSQYLNVISGNGGSGIWLSGASNLVTGNYIGTNWDGTAALQKNSASNTPTGNGVNGIDVVGNSNTIGGAGGVGLNSPGNVISNNGYNGIEIHSDCANTIIQGNYIGTASSGKDALGNGHDGVYVMGAAGNGNTVGGNAAKFQNIISANGWYGIDVTSFVTIIEDFNFIGVASDGTTLLKNSIDGSNGTYGANDTHQ